MMNFISKLTILYRKTLAVIPNGIKLTLKNGEDYDFVELIEKTSSPKDILYPIEWTINKKSFYRVF